MTEVDNRLKPFGACPCADACGAVGKYQVRTYKDGTQHVVGCICKQCKGRRSRRTGGKAQRHAQNLLSVPKSSTISTGHEEHAGGLVAFEVKSGAQIRPLITAFERAEKQVKQNEAVGNKRPIMVCAVPNPTGKDVVYAFRARSKQDLIEMVTALATQLGLLAP